MIQPRAAAAAVAGLRAAVRLTLLVLCTLSAVGCSARWGAPWESREANGKRTITGPSYVVKAGDTLQVIGWQAGLDHLKIAEWNRLRSPDKIFVGQVLRLTPPPGTEAPGVLPARAPAPGPSGTLPRSESARPVAAPSRPPPAPVAGAPRLQWPTTGKVTQTFAPNDPARKGMKIRGALGQPIVAAEAGQVVYSGSGLVGYGPLIIVQHNENYLTAYGHNRKILVQQGDQVTKGQRIAEMGLAAGQPLLHFEVRREGEPVDPAALLPRR
jgi:lipoprotein NlpD